MEVPSYLEQKAMKKEFLTSRQVATAISLSLGTVQKMIDAGEFKYFTTIGGHRRVLASSVDKYLAKRKKMLTKLLYTRRLT
jgi:excisionase family DNA binding protein